MKKIPAVQTNYAYFNHVFINLISHAIIRSLVLISLIHFSIVTSFQRIKETLEQNGEVMLRLETGEKIELHKHNVTLDDSNEEIKVDAGTETYWIPADTVAYYWIHKEGIEKE